MMCAIVVFAASDTSPTRSTVQYVRTCISCNQHSNGNERYCNDREWERCPVRVCWSATFLLATSADLAHGNMHAPAAADSSSGSSLIRIGSATGAQFFSTVVQVPCLLTEGECATLIAAADDHVCWLDERRISRYGTDAPAPQMYRLPVADFACKSSKALVRDVFRERVLKLLETELQTAASAFFGACTNLNELACSFKGGEPAVNVYHSGGFFEPHQDHEHLTVLVPLSSPTAYEGGGTAFWPEDQAHGWWMPPCEVQQRIVPGTEVILKPTPGDALLWGGLLPHSGVAVKEGVRHVLVGSFSLDVQGAGQQEHSTLTSTSGGEP